MGLFTATGKLKKDFLQLEMFDVYTTGDTAHIDKIFTARIIGTLKNIDAPMLTRVWQELEFRIDVCRVTRGAHIERL
jgi:hypothetical protein